MKRKDNNLINIIKSKIFGDVSINITNEASREERMWYVKKLRKDWVSFWMYSLACITSCIVIGKSLYSAWIGIINPVMKSRDPVGYVLSYPAHWSQRILYVLETLLHDLIYMTALLVFLLVVLKIISVFRYRIK